MEKMTEKQIGEVIEDINIEDDVFSCEDNSSNEADFCDNYNEGEIGQFWDNIAEDCKNELDCLISDNR